jgi:hypothetical protein
MVNENLLNIILIENEAQVVDCLKWRDNLEGTSKFVALSPFAINELDKKNVEYTIIDDYYDSTELYELGSNNHKRIEELCKIIDRSIKINYGHNLMRITPAFFSLANLKMLHDTLLVRVFQICYLIKRLNPDRIYVYADDPTFLEIVPQNILFRNEELIYGYILSLLEWEIDVIVVPNPAKKVNLKSDYHSLQTSYKRINKRFSAIIAKNPKIYDFALASKRNSLSHIPKLISLYLKGDKKSLPVLLLGSSGYNWDDCIKELKEAGISPLLRIENDVSFWINAAKFNNLDTALLLKVCDELEANNEFRKYFIFEHIDFYPVIKSRINYLIVNWSIACIQAYHDACSLMADNNVTALITSTISSCTSQSIALAAREYRIPVVTWQHGSFGYFDWPLAKYTDAIPSDYFFVFGKGIVEKYAHSFGEFNTKMFSAGSTSLSSQTYRKNSKKVRKVLDIESNKKIVVYAMANFNQNRLYISWFPPFSDNKLWDTQKSIVDIFCKNSDYIYLIKLHPSYEYRDSPVVQEIKDKGLNNFYFIKNEISFADLLSIANMVVIDVPSTVLLQSLTTKLPIFCSLDHIHIDAKHSNLLKKRVYCYDSSYEFNLALKNYLSTEHFKSSVDLEDTGFLNLFGTLVGSNDVGKNAASKLVEIIHDWQKYTNVFKQN